MNNMKRACDYGSKYAEELQDRIERVTRTDTMTCHGSTPVSNLIVQAILALTTHGVFAATLQLGQRWDELIRRDRLRYTPFILYILFLSALSCACVLESVRIQIAAKSEATSLTPGEAEACVTAVINGVGTANRAVQVAEALGIDKLFRIGEDES